MQMLAGLLCGFIFGLGLLISGMVQPTKVLGFLDIFGAWDPSLAVVMAVALSVTSAGFTLARKLQLPAFAAECQWPTKSVIDRPLVLGSALFGAGWGLVGLCPGPALENLASLSPQVFLFVITMAIGSVAHDTWQRSRSISMQRQAELQTSSDG